VHARVACVDVPELPLQLLLRREPSWRTRPVVVVKDDRPQGIILWANTHARSHRVLPGMTFAAARSLAASLHAAVVAREDIDAAVSELHLRLSNMSPRVEPSLAEPGVFYVDPTGMVPLFGSLEQWAETIAIDLRGSEFTGSVVVGFHRYRSYALTRTAAAQVRRAAPEGLTRSWVLPDPATVARLAAAVPLTQLGIDPDLRDQLRVLGVRTLGQFLRLPPAELAVRFGEPATRLHALASDRFTPLQPRELADPVTRELQLEPPDADHTRLLFGLKGTLHRAMDRLAERSEAMTVLHLRLVLDHAGAHDEYIEPAEPTLDVPMLVELVRLRLESLVLPAAVEEVIVRLEGIRASAEQLALFRTQRRRDLDAAARAMDRLRALFGPEAVTRAKLRAAHLPEASFTWEPMKRIDFPSPTAVSGPPPLCRRVLPRPVPLPPRPRHEPEAWLGRRGAVARLDGPYRVSGGWWVRTVERDYYYAETQHGEVLWIFYDRPRRRWFLHGYVD
jgi:protein ImuB